MDGAERNKCPGIIIDQRKVLNRAHIITKILPGCKVTFYLQIGSLSFIILVFFPRLGLRSGNFFLISAFPDHCLLSVRFMIIALINWYMIYEGYKLH